MKELGCVLINYLDEDDTAGFLQVTRTIKCVGIRGNSATIRNQHDGWRRVWEGNVTIGPPILEATAVAAIKEAGKLTYFHTSALDLSLCYDSRDGHFSNVMALSGARQDVVFAKFVVKKESIGDIFFSSSKTVSRHVEVLDRKDCTQIISTAVCKYEFCYGPTIGYMALMGMSGIPCNMPPLSVYDLTGTMETLQVYDKTQTWWRALFKSLLSMILEFTEDVLGIFFGEDWQVTVLYAGVLGIAVNALTRSQVLTLMAVTLTIFLNFGK
nr:MAG: glycoprotein [Flaviviridae sp.]